ncbi:lipoyl(octanoyl) transferase LipB [Stakelama marina]|uniref:Octanoyltransferase n=1 Tax=Stakelama marina TaxID=2826939 RepID=A0A8T4IGT1_9SPHN|nr:lipoyl(octanoyl) transferase LipB [Stakelama marina]MBR0553701.1 lipoyl(octanoyl) transferase LipB [Stakelama marina]
MLPTVLENSQSIVRDGVEWRIAREPVGYPEAVAAMEARVADIQRGEADELVWLLEHPPLYTAGTSAEPGDLVDPRFPVFPTGRGGKYTYHGPGQRVGYLMLDLGKRGRDVRRFVHSLENWLISSLSRLGIEAWAAPERVGIWTDDGGQEAKIGAIGIRVKRWVTLHGFSMNISANLSDFGGIIPCGLPEFPVTSAERLNDAISLETFDAALAFTFAEFLASLSGGAKNDS